MRKSLALIFIIPFSLYAESLSQLVELSKNNKMIESSQRNLESVEKGYDSLKAGYLPQVTISADYQETNKETSSVPDNRSTVQGTVSYVLYDGGKKYDLFDSYEAQIKSSSENLTNQKNEIVLQVINYYYSYLTYEAQKESKLKEIEQLNAEYKRLKRFLDVGSATEDEVQKIISNIESAQVELHEIELNIQTIIHNLEYVVGKSVTIENGSKIKDYESKEVKLRADLRALEHDLEAQLATAKSQRSDYLPTLTISDSYSSNDLNYKTAALNGNSSDYEQNIAAVNLNWKIFDFGSANKSYESEYKKYLALKSQYEYEKNKASVDLKLALKSYEIGKLKIKSAEAGLKAANSAYESIKAKFQNGLVDNVSYLEALSEKYDAKSTLDTALNELEVDKANIIYYSGENLEEFVK